MNHPAAALGTLLLVIIGAVVVFSRSPATNPEAVPDRAAGQQIAAVQEPVSGISTNKLDNQSPPENSLQQPQNACNALGIPIPVVRDTSALHDPAVVARLLSRLPRSVTQSVIVSPPDNAGAINTEGMVWIPGGTFVMGSDTGPADELPPHPVAIDGFWMDKTEVTNRQFQEFVDATGYVTLPEKKPELRSIQPGSGLENVAILEEYNQPGSICSLQLQSRNDIDSSKGAYSWWQYVPGANWKHPEGPKSDISDRMDHPVVHITWIDAMAYCRWAGKTLPTEAQWEYAARAGMNGNFYPWGNQQRPDDRWKQNIWQGTFPIEDTAEDGFNTTAPVASFEANAYGLHDMTGNVWEWCADYYQPEYYFDSPVKNPPGPDSSFDPQEPGIIKRVQRGGSFMCSDQYCIGYRTSARMKGEEDTGAFHTGFRCIVPVAQAETTKQDIDKSRKD